MSEMERRRMALGRLKINRRPELKRPKLLLGFSGWMDSGEVSTGTIKFLIKELGAKRFARIEPEGFYIQNFPGTMELAAKFRPYTRIKDGEVKVFEEAANVFFSDERNNVILFIGKEPNLQWREFSECVFSLCREFGVEEVYFIGGVAHLVPHTREPRISCSVSDAELKGEVANYGVKFANYKGPASIVTYLTANAKRYGLKMASFVVTVPAYVQGNNPKCIESVTRRAGSLLDVHIEIDEMRKVSDEFERRLNEIVERQPELAANIRKLEENYDNEVFDKEMGDLREWLEEKGVRLD